MRDDRLHAPAAERNREPILRVLTRVLPATGTLLEVASGTGQHAACFAAALPDLTWQPSEIDGTMSASIVAWTQDLPNVRPPIRLDVCAASWPVGPLDAIYSANMIHITPWEACLGLLAGAGRHLRPGGVLVLYGPYRLGGAHTAPSNAAFDADLRARDPRWGVRDFEAVDAAARAQDLTFAERVEMPANNQIVIWRRSPLQRA